MRKKCSGKKSGHKMRGGRSKMRGGNPESTYTTTEVISIILLIIALVLGLMFYFRKTNKPPIQKTINNIYHQPERIREVNTEPIIREPVNRGVPINVRTRGLPEPYHQMGILTSGDDVRPLYGRQTYSGSNRYNYYSSLDSNLSTKIPIFKTNDKCTDERGCNEINDGDTVKIGNIDPTEYTFTRYSDDTYRYIPFI